MKSPTKRLAEYVRKRDFAATPEPSGTPRKRASTKKLRFVVQEHRATRLHWDFRLEADGVMPSWAVTKGPTMVAGEKRLAMQTEDHPMDYRTFEGVIPAGNYGAGEVIVWDEGFYTLFEGDDPAAQIDKGKLKIVLAGHKLKGLFTLVRMKPREGEHGKPWLLFKDHDEYDDANWKVEDHAESVKTGRTLAQLQQSRKDAPIWKSNRAAAPDGTAVKRAARARAAAGADPVPRDVKPMLTTLVDEPFDDDRWLFELKWDGYRAIAVIEHDSVTLTSRNGKDLLHQFREMEGLSAAFRSIPAVVDGELCVLDDTGRPDFQALQSRDKPEARGLKRRKPSAVTFVVFDLIYADGRDLRERPLEERKRLLEELVVPDRGVLYSKHVLDKGTALFAGAEQRGLEGIVGKVRASTYRSIRSREWIKIKIKKRQELVVGGWTEPRGSRKEFGALLLGYYAGDDFVYAGHVGTGFDGKLLRDLMRKLAPLERKTSPFANTPKTNTRAHWAKPELVAEITFAEWTREGILRQPVFLGLRIDKDARSVVREREVHADPDA
ncbi:MAG TPA: non-homologous end-joining DNA ligase [Candidatus Elarobacter sp.]|nr:non-homologous end-joining DNA ligase [Candidatus Elarobacter sp.]